MKDANYAPVYAALYPDLAKIARSMGYALSVHGSLARDFDLVAIPWAEVVKSPSDLLKAITDEFNIRIIGGCSEKPHGRIAYTLSIGHGHCGIDLSFIGAAAMTSLDKTRQHATEHKYHAWFPYISFVSCQKCGVVKNDLNADKPCKGYVPVTMRKP